MKENINDSNGQAISENDVMKANQYQCVMAESVMA